MADTMAAKILRDHVVSGEYAPGKELALRVDQVLLQDATGTMACLQFEELSLDRVQVPLAVQYVDHNLIQLDFKNPDDHRFLQRFAARYGMYLSRPGNGICHYLHVERFARPGQVLVGADSHTTMAGSLGMIAIGAGGLEVAVCMAGHPFEIPSPKVLGVELRGALSPWVQAKDIILELLRCRGVSGGLGFICEFYGDGVQTLNVTQRGTICNMIAELGATGGIFPSDQRTREWLVYQGREEHWLPLAADPGASYDETEVIELGELEPLIAKPSSPGNVVPVREVAGTPAAQVCIGSSVNSGYEDLAIAAAVLQDEVVSPELVMTVTPGSRQILDTLSRSGVYRDLVLAGARMLEPACGPCVGMGQAPPSGAVSVRSFVRNFPGRSGTQDDQVYLCSPATAAATALHGVITDPRDLGAEPPITLADGNPAADDRQIIPPLPPDEAANVELVRGPNIKAAPAQTPLPDPLSGEVLIKVGDEISTGDMAPDGAIVMALRSNVEAMSAFVFRRLDPTFPKRARQTGGGFVVGGHTYGQGSSREHAVLAPKALGMRAVFAKSFARIHRRNLISQGIPPFIFADEADYDSAAQGETWELPDLHAALRDGRDEVQVRVKPVPGHDPVETGRTFTVRADFSERERNIMLAGGLLAYVRDQGT